jgi:hypothetical protein
MKIEKENGKKQPYEKPRLRTIELAAREVLAGNCKQTSTGSGPTGQCAAGAIRCVNIGHLGS